MSTALILCQERASTNSHSVTRYIVGFKKEESDFLLKFLYDHIALSQDLQTRIRWRPGTVVVWDVSAPFPINLMKIKAEADLPRTVSLHTALNLTGKMARDVTSQESPLRRKHHMRRPLKGEKINEEKTTGELEPFRFGQENST